MALGRHFRDTGPELAGFCSAPTDEGVAVFEANGTALCSGVNVTWMGKLPRILGREIHGIQGELQRPRQKSIVVQHAIVKHQNPTVAHVVNVVLKVEPVPPRIVEAEIAVFSPKFPMNGPIVGPQAHDLVSVANAQKNPAVFIQLHGVPMQVVYHRKIEVVDTGIHRHVVKAAPLLEDLFLRVQMQQTRVENLGVREAADAGQIFKHLLEQHHEIRPVLEAMNIVVIVVWGKRLGQGVQRVERGVHHGPLSQGVVVPHEFAGTPWFHVKSTKRRLRSPCQVGFVVDERGEHACGTLDD